MRRVKDHQRKVTRLHRMERARARRWRRCAAGRRKRHGRPPLIPGEVRITIPTTVSLEHLRHDALVLQLVRLRNALRGGHAVCIDFSATKEVIAGGMLLLFSELVRLKDIYPSAVMRCIPPKSNKVAEVLQHLKIFGLLNYESSVVPKRADVVTWRTASSSSVDGEQIGTVLESYKVLQRVQEKELFRGATEAVMNAVNHAYTEARGDDLPPPAEEKWWMFCREDEESLVMAVCDLGIGIPRSLPKKHLDELIREAMRKFSGGLVRDDAKLIQAAMEINRTRTDKRGRGKGLPDLKKIIDKAGGSLRIFSNRGMLKYENGVYRRKNYDKSIKGTLILWKIPLSGN